MKESLAELLNSISRVKVESEVETLLNKVNVLLQDDPKHFQLLQARAELYKKQQKFGLAINDYRSILSTDKDNKPAQIQIEQLLIILKYQNTDIFESPNTNFDPWLDD